MMNSDEEFISTHVLRKVDEAGITMFKNVVDQFLDNPEDDELIFRLHTFAVVVESAAGVHATRAADFLE